MHADNMNIVMKLNSYPQGSIMTIKSTDNRISGPLLTNFIFKK